MFECALPGSPCHPLSSVDKEGTLKARKSDCNCEPGRYNPRCEFHKGPDAGYGYDDWGRPNGKYSKRIGTIIATVLVGGLLLAATVSIVQLLSRS